MKKVQALGVVLAMLYLVVPISAMSIDQNCTMVIEFLDNRAPLNISTDQIRHITFRPTFEGSEPKVDSSAPAPATTVQPTRKTSPFDGTWHTHRAHIKCCSYSTDEDYTFTTDANGITSVSGPAFSGKKGNGNAFTFNYGPGNTVSITLSNDGKSFTGTFSDSNNHHGSFQGKR